MLVFPHKAGLANGRSLVGPLCLQALRDLPLFLALCDDRCETFALLRPARLTTWPVEETRLRLVHFVVLVIDL